MSRPMPDPAGGSGAALAVLLLGPPDPSHAIAHRIRAALPTLALAQATLADATTVARQTPPHLVLVPIDDEPAVALTAIRRLAWEVPAATIVALTARVPSDTALRAMRAGAGEILGLPLDATALAALVDKLLALRALATAAPSGHGVVWTVLAPKEGIGATTLVANLGLDLRRTHGRDVVLVDFDFRNADLAVALNLDAGPSLDDLARGFEHLDEVFLHGTLARHGSGLLVLAASAGRTREGAGLRAAQVAGVLDLLRARHEIVIVDAPPPVSDAVLAAVACSTRVLLPTEATVPCLRATWRTLEALAAYADPTPAVDVIVTRHAAGDEARLTLDEIGDALGRPVRHVLPREDETADLALNSGLPIAEVRGDGPLRHAIARLATMMDTTTNGVSRGPAGFPLAH